MLASRLPVDDVPGRDDLHKSAYLAGGRHSRERDAAAVRSHYDVGNDLYGLWLDRRLV
jgi:cyclopropane-fatty-acyl-phospholipid synthase